MKLNQLADAKLHELCSFWSPVSVRQSRLPILPKEEACRGLEILSPNSSDSLSCLHGSGRKLCCKSGDHDCLVTEVKFRESLNQSDTNAASKLSSHSCCFVVFLAGMMACHDGRIPLATAPPSCLP